MTWPVPKFQYGQAVFVLPLRHNGENPVIARVIDLHVIGMSSAVEYDVRYFHGGVSKTCRVFEDELEAVSHD
jgi:hypothetical protein